MVRRYALVMETISEGVYDWDMMSGAFTVTARMAAIVGLATTELRVEDWRERIHPDDVASYRAAVQRHVDGETERLQCEYRIRRADADHIWIADVGRCVRSDSGEARHLVGAIRNITGRKLAEKRLQSAQIAAERASRQLRDAIESISEGIVLFDADDRVLLFNSNFRQYFAATAGEAVAAMIKPGAVFWDFIRAAHARGMLPGVEPYGGIDAYIEMRKRVRRDPREPLEQLLSDGRWLQINEHRTADGGIASVYTDVTELKRREVELSRKTAMLETLSSRLSKYLSSQVFAAIFKAQGEVTTAPARKKLTVFFSDIVDFAALVDTLESEELTSLLNQYLTEMSRIAVEHGATVDKFIGDAIVAFFGDPVAHGPQEDAASCVRMALAMQRRVAALRREWQTRGIDAGFQLRVGIATGFCTVGNFGSDDRLDYTAIGHAVNLASRLQNMADAGGIMLDYETFQLARDEVAFAEEVSVEVKGLAKPVRVFKLMPADDEVPDLRIARPGIDIRIASAHLHGPARAKAVDAVRAALAVLEAPEGRQTGATTSDVETADAGGAEGNKAPAVDPTGSRA